MDYNKRTACALTAFSHSLYYALMLSQVKRLENSGKSGSFLTILVLLFTFVVFYLDCITGEEITFFIFYIPSIMFMAWYCGRLAGWLMVVLTSLMWLRAQWDVEPMIDFFFLLWNALIQITTFSIICSMTLAIRQEERNLKGKSLELTRSNQALEEFAYKAAHDLQAPLLTVVGYAELIEEKYRDSSDAEVKDFTEKILKGCDRMKSFIHDLLEHSKVIKQDAPTAPADFNLILKEVLENFRFEMLGKKAEVTLDTLPTLSVNANLIALVFQNLIGNALKYCEQPPRIHVRATQQGKEWLFSVRDNGIGIPAEARERVFVMFEKLATHKKYPGSGIGLATCQKIISQCGGKIWVESQEGEGSTFYFTFPSG